MTSCPSRHAIFPMRSAGITTVCDLGRPPFNGRAQSAWEDLEDLLIPAAEAGQLPIRVVSYMPLATWCVRTESTSVGCPSSAPPSLCVSSQHLAAHNQVALRRNRHADVRCIWHISLSCDAATAHSAASLKQCLPSM